MRILCAVMACRPWHIQFWFWFRWGVRVAPKDGVQPNPSRTQASSAAPCEGSKRRETESPVWMQLMAWASSLPTETCRTLRVRESTCGESGIVLATTTWVRVRVRRMTRWREGVRARAVHLFERRALNILCRLPREEAMRCEGEDASCAK